MSAASACANPGAGLSDARAALLPHTPRLDLGSIFKGVPLRRTLTLRNTAALPCGYSFELWRQRADGQLLPAPAPRAAGCHGALACAAAPAGEGASGSWGAAAPGEGAPITAGEVGVSVTPRAGVLQPGQSVRIRVNIDPMAEGVARIFGVCSVDGMAAPRGFVVGCTVKGLRVGYRAMGLEEWRAAGRPGAPPASRGSSAGSAGGGSRHGLSSASSCGASAAAAPSSTGLGDGTRIGSGCGSRGKGRAGGGALALDFGVCGLGQPASRVLVLTNTTSMATDVSAWVEQYPSAAGGPLRWTTHTLPPARGSSGGASGAGAAGGWLRTSSAASCGSPPSMQHASGRAREPSPPPAPVAAADAAAASAAATDGQGPRSVSGVSGLTAPRSPAAAHRTTSAGACSLRSARSPSRSAGRRSPSPEAGRPVRLRLAPDGGTLAPFAHARSRGNAMMAARRQMADAAAALGLDASPARGAGRSAGVSCSGVNCSGGGSSDRARGLALAVAPGAGRLEPGAQIAVEVVAFSAMVGTYGDTLVVQVRGGGCWVWGLKIPMAIGRLLFW